MFVTTVDLLSANEKPGKYENTSETVSCSRVKYYEPVTSLWNLGELLSSGSVQFSFLGRLAFWLLYGGIEYIDYRDK